MSNQVENLLIDRVTPIQSPPDRQLKQWASNQRVFVSSTMDDLRDIRRIVSQVIIDFGSQPILFETLGARSDDSRQAYKSEVRRSQIYFGILSHRYGAKLPSGYSATHEEYEEAKEYNKDILLFLDDSVPTEERDGHLNRWIKELYQTHVLAKYIDIDDLQAQIKKSLVEIARDEITPWVKIDNVIFQATLIERMTKGKSTTIKVTTSSQDPQVTLALDSMGQTFFQRRSPQLTFRQESFRVEVESLKKTIDPLDYDSLVLTCNSGGSLNQQSPSQYPLIGFLGGYSGLTGRYEHRDLVMIALRRLVLGEEPPPDSMFASLPYLDFKALYRKYGDDTQVFSKIVSLLITEAVHTHGILEDLVSISTGMVRDGRLHIRISGFPSQVYSNQTNELVEVEGEISIE